ncbi:unnamed protein product [Sphagnum troendelagicum]|uniref:Uncharacterized protein n=1 Tax=Sphagnum troendelagicum TaxID=128251 RepID=A0ABP0TBT6_9BRYO
MVWHYQCKRNIVVGVYTGEQAEEEEALLVLFLVVVDKTTNLGGRSRAALVLLELLARSSWRRFGIRGGG